MLIVTHSDVRRVLDGQDLRVLDVVREAYRRHAVGETALPHSVFLRFPGHDRDRIIGLPAYLGGDPEVAGVKWISSFPGNIEQGQERASAVVVLNSMRTGHPTALIEASLISARRTAASAALAASILAAPADEEGVGVIGCGPINREVVRFLRAVHPQLRRVSVYDLVQSRMRDFAAWLRREAPDLDVRQESGLSAAVSGSALVSIATTAATPYLDAAALRPGSLVLHVSLRDITASSILGCVNVVDDPDHVCRAGTSLDLAERSCGDRSFISASIGDLLLAGLAAPRDPDRVTVFSPFGLGVLDLAVAELVRTEAEKAGLGTRIEGFLATPAR